MRSEPGRTTPLTLGFAVVLASGCASAGSPAEVTPDAQAMLEAPPRAVSAAVVKPPAVDQAVLDRLAQEKLSGLAVAHPRAMFFPTAEAARAAAGAFRPETVREQRETPSAPAAGDGVGILEDLGEVVKVTTDVGKEDLPDVDGRFKVEVFVKRAALLPVLRAPFTETYGDGTAVLLREGAVMTPLVGGAVPVHELLAAALAKPLDGARVGLSFEPPAARAHLEALAPGLAGAELGCDRESVGLDKTRIRVADRAVLIDEQIAEARAKNGGSEWSMSSIGLGFSPHAYGFGCTLVDQVSYYEGVDDAALSVDGNVIGVASGVPLDGCSGSVGAVRAPGSTNDAFVTFSLPRGAVRARTKITALVESGGCGMGMMGGPRPTVQAVKRGATAYFPGGAKAGTHVASSTKLRHFEGKPTEDAGRTCVGLRWLSVPLCFDAADLIEVKD